MRGESVELTALPEGAEFYLSDHQGSPLVRVDAQGDAVSSTAYHPYGHVRSQTGAAGDPFSFVGNEADRGTGISDFHARLYRPELGAFLVVDPVALFTAEKQLQQPAHLGAYLYAAADPIGMSDPDGLEPTRMQRYLAKANQVVAGLISDGVCMMLGGCGQANAPRVGEKVHNAPTDGEVALNIVAAHVAPRVSGRIVGRLVQRESSATMRTSAAVQGKATAEATRKLLALGRNRGADGQPLLKPFANKVGAKRVLDLESPKGLDLPQEISLRMREADEIHFNLAQMGDLSAILTEGRRFVPGSNVRFTSWEFSQVMDNAALRAKTFFHMPDGAIVSGPQFRIK